MTAGSLTRSVPKSRKSSGPSSWRERAQVAPAAARREVADRPAEEGDDARAAVDGVGDVVEVALEVADDPVHAQPVELLDQPLRAGAHHRLGDVDRHVAVQRAGLVHRAQQQARLGGGAGAELDQLGGARALDDLGGALLQDRPLAARRVVLGQVADLVEQLGADRVVEVLGRQLLERARQAVEDVVGQRAVVTAAEERLDDDALLGGAGRGDRVHQVGSPRSRASRTPAKICRRSGRSQLRNVAVATRGCVAQEPPRRTRYRSPKKTSEYSRYGWATKPG